MSDQQQKANSVIHWPVLINKLEYLFNVRPSSMLSWSLLNSMLSLIITIKVCTFTVI